MKTASGHPKVLDLTRILASPWPTQNLTDHTRRNAAVLAAQPPRPGSQFLPSDPSDCQTDSL